MHMCKLLQKKGASGNGYTQLVFADNGTGIDMEKYGNMFLGYKNVSTQRQSYGALYDKKAKHFL